MQAMPFSIHDAIQHSYGYRPNYVQPNVYGVTTSVILCFPLNTLRPARSASKFVKGGAEQSQHVAPIRRPPALCGATPE